MSVNLYPLTEADVLLIDKLWREHLSHETSLPSLRSRVVDAVAKNEEGKLIGYGQVKVFGEAMLFLDPTARKRDRAKATQQLMNEAIRGAKKANLDSLYCFIKNPAFATFISNTLSCSPPFQTMTK